MSWVSASTSATTPGRRSAPPRSPTSSRAAIAREFLNPRSPAFKAKRLDPAKITPRQAIDLIAEDSRLMKRPLVITGGRIIAGFDRERLRDLFS